MTKVKYRAVIMDYAGDGERTFEFEEDAAFFDLPSDEIIDGLIRRISAKEGLKSPMRYELNVAKRYPEKSLVCAFGVFLMRSGNQSPFIAMIGPARDETS
jgi:hypothetical protein